MAISIVPNPASAPASRGVAGLAVRPLTARSGDPDPLAGLYQALAPGEQKLAVAYLRGLAARPQADARRDKPLVVLKFGSSVLRSSADAPEAVTEIYRAVRQGRRVLAVVSAFAGVTDRLLAEAAGLGCGHDNRHLPRYAALGEEISAATLALACDRAGLNACSLSAAELGIIADGPPQDAACASLEPAAIEAAFQHCDVVIAPGFAGRSEDGEVMLLGRGGSDLTAVFLAAELGAERVRLIKDVDGVYAEDPKTTGNPLRYANISWETARRLTGRLVQDRAMDLAHQRRLLVEVGALSSSKATCIGASGAPPRRAATLPRLKVAIAGCGVVGGGVVERLRRRPEAFEIVGVLVRDAAKARDVEVSGLITTDPARLLAAEPDLLVDALSSAEAGAALMEAALLQGVDVASANKQGLIGARAALFAAAEAGSARLAYSAAVGGGAPMVEAVRSARAQGPIVSIEGVLNGTVNFVLGQLASGRTLEEALAGARAAGLAEEDASADLEGHDAVAKLRILAYEAFGADLAAEDVTCSPLDEGVARWAAHAEPGTPVKQVATLLRKGERLVATVAFAADPRFASARGEGNLLLVTGAGGQVWSAQGRGAGRWPTAESVLADLLDLRAARVEG